MNTQPDVAAGIQAIEESLREADRYCEKYYNEHHDDSDFESFKYHVEKSFIELLVFVDVLRIEPTRRLVASVYMQAASEGFGKTDSFEGETYSHWTGRIRMVADAIASAHGVAETSISEVKDLKEVLKRAVYVICDPALFPNPPKHEADIHSRLEAILKCHYADLKTKPALTKSIKNFQPDTGLPSAKTLLEYKFISTKADAKRVVDEILADASGYRSKEWKNLLFVIYETRRVLPEEEWRALLKDCRLLEGFDAIVLSGESARGTSTPSKGTRRRRPT